MRKNVHVHTRCIITCQSEKLQVISCWLMVIFRYHLFFVGWFGLFLHRVFFFSSFYLYKDTMFLIKSHIPHVQISTGLPKFCFPALGLKGREHKQLVSRALCSPSEAGLGDDMSQNSCLQSPQPARSKLSTTNPGIKKPRLFMQGQKVVIRHTRKLLLQLVITYELGTYNKKKSFPSSFT